MSYPRLFSFLAVWVLSGAVCFAKGQDFGKFALEISKNAPRMIGKLGAKNCKRVGVLKFRITHQGVRKRVDNTSPLNKLCADLVEDALANAAKALGQQGNQVLIIRDASRTAAGLAGANHTTLGGQRKLFRAKYPTADGARVGIDAFVTGDIRLQADTMDVDIYGVLARSEKFMLLRKRNISLNGQRHAVGMSFQRREIGGGTRLHVGAQAPQAQPGAALVSFAVSYDGMEVQPQIVRGVAQIRAPAPGQRVTLKLCRLDTTDRMLAAVVRVNGENVLGRDRLADIVAAKYVLPPEAEPVVISGFQKDREQADAFVVAARDKARELEVYYGEDVGTISLTLFREGTPTDPLDPNLRAILERKSSGVVAEGYAERSIIVGGAAIKQRVRPVEAMIWDPIPLVSTVISYFDPIAQ